MPATANGLARRRSRADVIREECDAEVLRLCRALETMLQESDANRLRFIAAAEAWSVEQEKIDGRLRDAIRGKA